MIGKGQLIEAEKKNPFCFPESWKIQKLKYVAKQILDGTHFTPNYIKEGVPFLRVTDIQTKKIDLDKVKYISQEEHDILCKRVHPKKGDVLLSKNGTIGILKIIDWDWEFSIFVSLCLIRLQKNVIPNYFAYYFGSDVVEQQIFESCKRTSVTNLHLVKIRELLISVPSVHEQNRIIDHLDDVCGKINRAITIKQKQLETLDALKKSIIHKAVTQGLDDSVEMKVSGVEWIGRIPAGWKVKIIKRNYKITLGKMLQSLQKIETETEEYYLRSANIKWDGVDISDVKKMWFSPADKKRLSLKSEDLLVSEGGDVGRSSLWKEELMECYIQNAINRIRPIPGRGSNRFLYYWLYTLKQTGYIDAIVSRITIAHLTAEKLEKLIYLSPPVHEQLDIANHLDKKTAQIEKLKKNIAKQIETLELYRKSIVHECVTGKKRIIKDDLREH